MVTNIACACTCACVCVSIFRWTRPALNESECLAHPPSALLPWAFVDDSSVSLFLHCICTLRACAHRRRQLGKPARG